MSIATSATSQFHPIPGLRDNGSVNAVPRFITCFVLVLATSLLLASCGDDIGSSANTDTMTDPPTNAGDGGDGDGDQPDNGPDPDPDPDGNEGEGEPTGGTSSDFTLSMPTTLALVEGSEGITVDLNVNRQNGHNRDIALTLGGAQSADTRHLEAVFSTTTLTGDSNSATLTLRVNVGAGPIRQQQRTLTLSANDGQTTQELTIDLGVEPIAAPDVYLLIGQSNMVGFSTPGEKLAGPGEADEPLARIRQLNVTGNDFQNFGTEENFTDPSLQVAFPRFVTAEDPLHESLNPSINGKSGTFVGLGLTFAKSALPSTEREIVLVPAAWAGTGFCNNGLGHIAWNAQTPSAERGHLGGTALHDRALERVNIALEESGGILRGILWHQGEADATESLCGNDYAENLRALIESLRSNIQIDARGASARGPAAPLPFVLGTMSRGNDERGDFAVFDAVKTTVDLAHRSLPAEMSGVAFSNHDDLVPDAFPCGQGSCIHFGAAAYREMGRRYFAQLQDLWSQLD